MKVFWHKENNQNHFCTGFPKSDLRGALNILGNKFLTGSRNKKLGKVKKFQVSVVNCTQYQTKELKPKTHFSMSMKTFSNFFLFYILSNLT